MISGSDQDTIEARLAAELSEVCRVETVSCSEVRIPGPSVSQSMLMGSKPGLATLAVTLALMTGELF